MYSKMRREMCSQGALNTVSVSPVRWTMSPGPCKWRNSCLPADAGHVPGAFSDPVAEQTSLEAAFGPKRACTT